MNELRYGSLFSGYLGLDMGVQSVLGGTTAWVSDVDKGANKILAHRAPGVPNIGDITAVDWSQVEPVDVLTGGFPCQDVSSAGKRAGIRPGTRSGLWTHFAYAISQLNPSLVVIENVRGLLSAEAHSELEPCTWCLGDEPDGHLRALGAVLGDLAGLGYDASWYGLRAADIGAPHGRFRVFIVAHPAGDTRWLQYGDGGAASDAEHAQLQGVGSLSGLRGGPDARADVPLLPTPDTGESSTGHGRRGGRLSNGHQSGDSLDQVAKMLPTPTARDWKDHTIRREPHRPDDLDTLARALTLLPTPAVNDMGEGKTVEAWDQWTAKMKAEHGNGNGHGNSLAIEAQRLLPTPPTADARDSRQSTVPNPRSPHDVLPDVARKNRWGEYADAVEFWESVTREAPAPVVLSEAFLKRRKRRLAGKDTRPVGMRGSIDYLNRFRLNPAFSEWMMGPPKGWITEVPDITRNEALKAAGNGVVPQQVAAAVLLLQAAERAREPLCSFEPPCWEPVVDEVVYLNPRMPNRPACAAHLAAHFEGVSA